MISCAEMRRKSAWFCPGGAVWRATSSTSTKNFPAQAIVQASKHDVPRKFFVEVLEVARHTAPPGQNHALFRRISAQEIMSLQKGSRGERDARLAAIPVHLLILPKPYMVHVRIGFQELT